VAFPIALVILLLQARGLSLLQIGLTTGLYSLVIVLLEVPTGGLADAIGRKRVSILAIVVLLAAGVTVFFALSFPLLLLAYVLYGIGRALSSGALEAWFVDSLLAHDPDIDLQPYLARAGVYTLLGLGIGTLVGSTLPTLFSSLPPDGSTFLTPLSTPILISIAVNSILLICTLLLVQENRHQDTEAGIWAGFRSVPGIIQGGILLSRRSPTILLLFGASISAGLAISSLESFWQPYFAGIMGSALTKSYIFGILMAGNFAFGMLGNLAATPLTNRFSGQYALVSMVFQAFWGVSLLVLAWSTGPYLAAGFFWLAYFTMGVRNSPHETLLNKEIPAQQRSAMLSISSLAFYSGCMIGGALLGYLADLTSISIAWTVSAITVTLSMGFYWRIHQIQKHNLLIPVEIVPIKAGTVE
jgi:MFS family permease